MLNAMKNRLHILFVLLSLPAFVACDEQKADKAEEAAPPPIAVTEQAAPAALNPLCFVSAVASATGVPLDPATCGQDGMRLAIDSPNYKPAEGFTGTAYRYADSQEVTPLPAFVEYKDLGTLSSGDKAVLVHENTGGSSLFSTLYVLAPDAEKFTIKDIPASGDRCTGGIVDATVEPGGALAYTANLTPSRLYDLAAQSKPFDFSSDALQNCTECCAAVASYKGGVAETVTLVENPAGTGDDVIAACFNDFASDRISEGKATMTIPELRDFMNEVRTTCQIR